MIAAAGVPATCVRGSATALDSCGWSVGGLRSSPRSPCGSTARGHSSQTALMIAANTTDAADARTTRLVCDMAWNLRDRTKIARRLDAEAWEVHPAPMLHRALPLLVLSVSPSLIAQTPETQATERVLFEDLGAALEQPQLAVRHDGALALVFVQDRRTVRIAVRPTGGDWGEPRKVCDAPDVAVGMHRGPRVAWSGDVLVVALIESRFDAKARKAIGSGNLLVRRSVDDGRRWSKPARVNGEDGSAREGLHALAARGERVAVIWLDPRGEPRGTRLFAAWSSDAGKSFGADAAVHESPSGSICPCCHPSLCLDQNGRAVALWRDAIEGDRDMFVGVLDPAGERITDPTLVGEGHWKLEACPMDGGGLALDSDDRPISVWRRDDSIFWSRGRGNERRLGRGINPVVAISGATALAVWQRGEQLVAARLPLDGTSAAPEVRVLGVGGYASIAASSDGRFVVIAERRDGDRCTLVAFEP